MTNDKIARWDSTLALYLGTDQGPAAGRETSSTESLAALWKHPRSTCECDDLDIATNDKANTVSMLLLFHILFAANENREGVDEAVVR